MAEQITLQECSSRLYDSAKRWWAVTNGLRVGVVVAGVAATLIGWAPLPAALMAGALALAAWYTQYRTDEAKDQANDLRRQMDLQDGMEWPIPSLALDDLGACLGTFVSADPPVESYFASQLPPGPERLLENVRETGFFSEHIAATAARAMWGLTAWLCLLAVGGIFVTVAIVDDITVVRSIGVVLASVLLVVEAVGVARLAMDYHGFQKAACETKTQANRMLSAGAVREVDALHLAESYFIHRARAPLLPGWVYSGIHVWGVRLYRGRRDELNVLWQKRYGS